MIPVLINDPLIFGYRRGVRRIGGQSRRRSRVIVFASLHPAFAGTSIGIAAVDHDPAASATRRSSSRQDHRGGHDLIGCVHARPPCKLDRRQSSDIASPGPRLYPGPRLRRIEKPLGNSMLIPYGERSSSKPSIIVFSSGQKKTARRQL